MTRIQIIKVPAVNGLGHTKKTRNAGNAIIAETGRGKEWDIEEIHVNNEDLEEQEELIYENAKESYETMEKVLFIGGDHSLTYSTGRAFLEHHGKESFMIILDAHADSMKPMKNPSHEEWLRALVEKAGWNPRNIALAGLRKIEPEEKKWLKDKGIKYWEMGMIENMEHFTYGIMEMTQGRPLYLSLDIDVVDPAFAPGTHYQEPGGFTSKEILHLIKRLSMMKNLKAADIVEVEENDEKTVKLAARILEILSEN